MKNLGLSVFILMVSLFATNSYADRKSGKNTCAKVYSGSELESCEHGVDVGFKALRENRGDREQGRIDGKGYCVLDSYQSACEDGVDAFYGIDITLNIGEQEVSGQVAQHEDKSRPTNSADTKIIEMFDQNLGTGSYAGHI